MGEPKGTDGVEVETVSAREFEAQKAHEACHQRWNQLSEEQRSGTTFHGWEAHLQH